jgi:hypothetical protein
MDYHCTNDYIALCAPVLDRIHQTIPLGLAHWNVNRILQGLGSICEISMKMEIATNISSLDKNL